MLNTRFQFDRAGKVMMKKDMGMIAMTYGNTYVAYVAMGANPKQAVKAFVEAEAHNGPSLMVFTMRTTRTMRMDETESFPIAFVEPTHYSSRTWNWPVSIPSGAHGGHLIRCPIN
jgi:hypothetical protein